MTQQQRKPMSKGYKREFDLLETVSPLLVPTSVAARSCETSSDISIKLETLWSSGGGGRGGQDLDDLLNDLGDAYVEDGYVKWDPPPSLDPVFGDYLSRSVEELNSHLRAGTLMVNEDGGIRPADGI